MELLEHDAPELADLIQNGVTRDIYRVLLHARPTPLSIDEIRERLDLPEGSTQQHLDRRLRDLDPVFEIDRVRDGRFTKYLLKSRRELVLRAEGSISKQLRAWVLRDQRCVQCGRTPSEDGVKLHVDHKVPQRWGGTNDAENLQALCAECNEGKRDYYATFDDEAPEILKAFTYDEPHRRIGEALKAAYPKKLRGDLLERIASAKQYQEDWQKRTRELRVLGWDIVWSKKKEQGRFLVEYGLGSLPPPWPEGNIRAEISRVEKSKKSARPDEPNAA